MTKSLAGGILASEFVQYDANGNIVTPLASGGSAKDGGPAQTVTRTFTQNNDISTARDITAAPTSGW